MFAMGTQLLNISDNKTLEGGIYSLKEAALFAKVSTKTLKRWYLGDAQTPKVLDNYELIEDGKFLNYLDFIQALAIRELRVHYKIPLPKIREAIERANKDYGIKHPFAKRHQTYYDGTGIYIELQDSGEFVQLTSPHANQFTMKKIVELYLKELSFNDEGYAQQYRPEPGILLDPSIRFGEPLLENFGITALTIYDAVLSEGSFDIVADLFEININEVTLAYKYIDSLKNAA
jgi:uncharacterized protein (DUF433 family)